MKGAGVHTSDARHARAIHAELGARGSIGTGRLEVGYAWHDDCNAYHICPRNARDGYMRHGYTNHMPWDMNGRRYATRAENTTHIARIGEQRGTYATLERRDANAMFRNVFAR